MTKGRKKQQTNTGVVGSASSGNPARDALIKRIQRKLDEQHHLSIRDAALDTILDELIAIRRRLNELENSE